MEAEKLKRWINLAGRWNEIRPFADRSHKVLDVTKCISEQFSEPPGGRRPAKPNRMTQQASKVLWNKKVCEGFCYDPDNSGKNVAKMLDL